MVSVTVKGKVTAAVISVTELKRWETALVQIIDDKKTKKKDNILGDSIIKHVNGYDIAGELNKCKVFVKSFFRSKGPCLKDHMKLYPYEKVGIILP